MFGNFDLIADPVSASGELEPAGCAAWGIV